MIHRQGLCLKLFNNMPKLTVQSTSIVSYYVVQYFKGQKVIAQWRWNVPNEQICGICQLPYESGCSICQAGGDSCPLCTLVGLSR